MSDEQTRDKQADDAKTHGNDAGPKSDDGHSDDAGDRNAGGKDDGTMADSDHADGKDNGADDDAEKKPSVFRKPIFWIILIVVVAVLVIGGTLYWLHARQFESTDDAFVDSHIVRITPEVSGRLTAIADVDNRHVQAGRLLAVISAGGSEAQLAQTQANVRQAEAQYAEALAQVAAARATAAQTAANARAPLANAIKAAQDLSRYEALARLDRNAVAGQQLDQARANARATNAQAVAARREISSAAAQVRVADRQAQAARAVIGARRAAVDAAGVTIGDLRLTAPVSGQVVNRQVNLGSYVSPGTQLMAIIPDRMWVTANFKETQLTLMRIGQHVTIKVDAFPDVAFEGRVDSIQRSAGQAFALLPPQNATGNYVKVVQRVPVRIEFDLKHGPDPRRYPIGPGMSVVPTVKVR